MVGGPVRALPAVRAHARRRLRRRRRAAARRRLRLPLLLLAGGARRSGASRRWPRSARPGYDGHCRALTRRAGRRATRGGTRAGRCASGCPMPDSTWDDLVRGPITFAADQVPDYVLVRANGEPLYTLVNPVDDALMRITHVLRGEDLLSSTPRQLALYDGAGGRSASATARRRASVTCRTSWARATASCPSATPSRRSSGTATRASCPEALLNYLALLGWSMGEDREFFGKDEMAAAFTARAGEPQPGALRPEEVHGDQRRLDPHARRPRTSPPASSPTSSDAGVVDGAAHRRAAGGPRCRRSRWSRSAWRPCASRSGCSRSCSFRGSASRSMRPTRPRSSRPRRSPVVDASHRGPRGPGRLECRRRSRQALRGALIDGLGLKPKVAFGPVRVAVTGRRISPPLFESLEILGRETDARAPARPSP